MRRVNSSIKLSLLECIDSKRDKWKVRWDEQKLYDMYTYEEQGFDHKPSLQEIQDLIYSYYNKQTENKIINDFEWNNKEFYLSKENQINYQMYHNAILSGSMRFPLRVKLKDNSYMEFNTNGLYEDFYSNILRHINKCLQEGWNLKDNINWKEYE
jgi:hypothetical protein